MQLGIPQPTAHSPQPTEPGDAHAQISRGNNRGTGAPAPSTVASRYDACLLVGRVAVVNL